MRTGSIRLASQEELDAWVDGAARRRRVPGSQARGRMRWRAKEGNAYMVLDAFDLPGGQFGGDARVFIVPPGKAMPGGPRDHCTILQMDRFQCYGPGCD